MKKTGSVTPKSYRERKMEWCPRCGKLVPSFTWHEATHATEDRYRPLLNNPEFSFAEIARQTGVTRERVRQIAFRLGYTGRMRAKKRNFESYLEFLVQRAEMKSLRQRLPNSKIEVRYHRRYKYWFRLPTVWIDGRMCWIRKLTVKDSGQGRRVYAISRPRVAVPRELEFVLYYHNESDMWLVVPVSKLPKGVTTMFTNRSVKAGEPGFQYACRHDWRSYLEAWDLLNRWN